LDGQWSRTSKFAVNGLYFCFHHCFIHVEDYHEVAVVVCLVWVCSRHGTVCSNYLPHLAWKDTSQQLVEEVVCATLFLTEFITYFVPVFILEM
jgi:hypothetical protein